MPVATTIADASKMADGTYTVPSGGAAAKNGNYTGSLAQQAGTFAAGTIAGGITPAGCDQSAVVQAVNGFLGLGGGLVKAAILQGAWFGGPEVALPTAAAMAIWNNSTTGGCSPGVPSPPATQSQVAGVSAQVAAVPAIGGLSGLSNQLDSVYEQLLTLCHAHMVPVVGNPLFWGRVRDVGTVHGEFGSDFVPLNVLTLDSRNPGEATLDWCKRLVPSWFWQLEPNGFVSGYLDPSSGQGFGPYVVYPWDVWAVSGAPHWTYLPSSGPPRRDVMDDIVFFMQVDNNRPEH